MKNRFIDNDVALANEKTLKGILDNLQDAFFEADLQSNFMFVNAVGLEMYGYNSPDELIGKPVKSLYADEKERNRMLETLRKTGKIVDWTGLGLKKDGTSFLVSMNVQIIKNDAGQAIGTQGIVRDISERHKTLEALHRSEERNRLLSDVTMEGILIHRRGIAKEMNQAVQKLFGDETVNLINKSFIHLIHEDDRERVIKNMMENWASPFEVRAYRGNGEIFFLEMESKNFLYQDEEWQVTALRDITERKRNEETIRLSEEKFRKAFFTSPDSIAINRFEDGMYLSINKGFTQILEYTELDVAGKTSLELNIWVNADDRKRLGQELIAKGYVENLEAQFRGKNGKILDGLMSANIIELEGVPHILSVTRDITERKKIERDIIYAKEKAEESDRLKSAFLANMSHEIRTPMNGILGFAELLKEPSLSGETQQEYIRIIEKAGARMLNIITNIVDISKIESGQMLVNITETNVNEQIDYLEKFFVTEVENKGLNLFIRNSLPSSETIIKTDREKLYAILTNLIKNAIKYTEKGFIEIGCQKKVDFIEFYVKDTGIGVPKDRQEPIFERFIQADISNKMAKHGAGLGLSISKAYVEMLGGKIWMESEMGIGSTFYFTIAI